MLLSLLDICVLHSRKKKCLVHAVGLGEDIAEEISSVFEMVETFNPQCV